MLSRREFLKVSGCAMAATFLPMIQSRPAIGHIGVHILNYPGVADLIVPGTTVQILASWMDIETSPGIYDWAALDKYTALVPGYPLVIGVHRAPEWARVLPDYAGSRLKPGTIPALYDFCEAVLDHARPQGLELWNEPDVDPLLLPPDLRLHIGAWGSTDSAEGGEYYGRIFEGLYQRLFRRVLLRGPACMWPKDFLFGALDYCKAGKCLPDIISFHQYQYYWHPIPLDKLWDTAKIIHERYDRPVCLSETNLLIDAETIEFEQRQVEYFEALEGTRPDWGSYQIYNLIDPEWNNAYLVDWSGRKRPAYDAYKRIAEGKI